METPPEAWNRLAGWKRQLRNSQSELQLLSEVKEEPDEGGGFFNFSLMCEETWDKTAGTCTFQSSLNLPRWFGCTRWRRSTRLALAHLITKANIPVRNKDQC